MLAATLTAMPRPSTALRLAPAVHTSGIGYIASRKACTDFDRFEPLLQKCQADLAAGKRKPRPFAKEQQIHEGLFFVLKGILLYVAEVGEKITHDYGAFSRTAPSPICCCVSMCSTGRPASRTARMVHRAARHNRARRRQA
jgi:hypothetical protein